MARLLIIDPALEFAEAQGVESVLHEWDGESTVVQPALRGDGPNAASGYEGIDGVVVFGSASSVHDPRPWLADLGAWLQPIVDGVQDIPLFGICFGHQLVAHLGGGEVGYLRDDQSKLVAFEDSRVGGRLLDPAMPLRVIASHREEVKQMPDGFEVVGARPRSVRDAMQHRTRDIYTVQFHPEAREAFATRIGLAADGVDDELRESSQALLGAFRSIVRTRAASR